ncbi:retrovirus-related pol polyprotein from transposon TNT 1-94 [Tanacetum coccineum]
MVPRTVLTRSGPITLNTARPVNTVQPRTAVNNAGSLKNVINNAYSTARRPFYKITAANNSNFTKKVNTVKVTTVNTAKPKAVVNTVRQKAVLSAVKGNKGNAVKASACWVWKPKTKVLDHVSKHNSASMLFKRFDYGNPQQDLKNKGVIDSGCSRHMTGNRSYRIDYKEIDGGFVAFEANSKGEKLLGKKNSVLFTDTECVVLSPDFKLTDESHVLLKVPRKDNMYSVDLKNVIPQGGLTCLFTKATPDESNLWHRRLGHMILVDLKVKVIRCDNGTESKNRIMNQFCEMKGFKRKFSVARTPQQNGVAERKNRTLIEAAKTMLADSKLPTTFWAEAVNTACRKPALSFMRPFGCPVKILNTIDHLGKFNGKADEWFFVGYSTNRKAFRVLNSRTRIVEENLHVQFSENTPNIARSGPNWIFNIDALTNSMNYKPVVTRNQSNGNAGTKACNDAGKARMEIVPGKNYILLPMWPADPLFSQDSKSSPDVGFKPSGEEEKKDARTIYMIVLLNYLRGRIRAYLGSYTPVLSKEPRPNGDALWKCILKGPYTSTIVTTPDVLAKENSPTVPEQTTVETVMNMTPENRAYFKSEKEAIHLILIGIGDEIYSTIDACQTAQEIFYKMMNEMIRNNLTVTTMQVNVQFLQQLQPEWSRFVTIVKQQHKLDEVSYHKLFDILKQYQKEVNELRAERMAKNANPLALVATAQTLQDPYYQTSKPHKSYAPTSKASLPTRSHATTRYKGKEIAKPITPPSESASEEDSDPEQAQKDKDMQKNLALIAKYFKKLYKPTNNNLRTSSNTRNKNVDTTPRYKNDNQTGQFGNQRAVNVVGARETVGGPVVQQSGIQCFNCKEFGHYAKECRKPKRVKDSTYHKEKMLLCKQAEKGVQLQAEQSDWLADTDEEIDEQELEAHYSYMAKIQEVPNADSGTDAEPLEQVQYDTDDNVFANDIQHFDQSESISNTCAVETGDSNVTPDSPDMCDNDIQDDQNDVECDDERVALANLIANLKLDVDENKKIQKQLKKANATLTQELTECKSILAETSRTLGESNSIRDSCLVALQNKQTEFERYKAFNDRTVDYDKLKYTLNETLGLLAYVILLILKKLIDKCKGKSVDTKFDKPSVVQQPNDQRIPKPSVLGKPAPFSNSLERTNFAKKKSVSKTNESYGLSKPVTPQNLPQTATQAVRNKNVIKPGMYQIASSTTQTKAPQLTQTSRNTNPRVTTFTGVAHRTNVSRPQPRSNQMKDKVLPNTSQVKFKKTKVEDHPRISRISNQTKSITTCNDSLNSRTLNVNAVCATCGRHNSLLSFNHRLVKSRVTKVGKLATSGTSQELSRVHHTFHVSNLKKCYADEPLVMSLEGIHVDDKLQLVGEPIEIMEWKIKQLKRSHIPLVKVRWNSRRGPEFTWEREDSSSGTTHSSSQNRASSSTTRFGGDTAEATDDSKWYEMDGNAITNLHLTLADGVLSSIEENKSANEIWDHLARFCKIDSQEHAEILLQILPDSYDQVIINLTSNVLSDYLVFDDVAAAILQEEDMPKNKEDRQTSSKQVEALVVMRRRSMEPHSGGSHNHALQNMLMLCVVKQRLQMKAGRDLQISNDHELKIIGIGSIMVKMHDTVRTIRFVRTRALVPMRGEKVVVSLYELKGEIIEDVEASVASHSTSHRVAVAWH